MEGNISKNMNNEEVKNIVMGDIVHVKFILDKSGSMEVMGKEPVQSLNNFINEQKKYGEFLFTLTLFSDVVNIIKNKEHSSSLGEFKEDDYNAGGMTALYDAIGKTISPGDDNSKVIVVILTDGLENSSREYTKSMIRKIIKEKEKKGWKFIYLGANQDSYAESSNIGLRAGVSCDYEYNDLGLRNIMRTVSDTVKCMRTQSFEPSARLEEDIEEDKDVEDLSLSPPPSLQRTISS